jgi:thioredoxin-like negative regulator of GroEL
MKVRSLLVLTSIVSSILGALVVYLVLSVPNDLRADSLLKDARQNIQDGQSGKARDSLLKIVQQYPRTDAAAAATAALITLEQKDRAALDRMIATLRTQDSQHAKSIDDLRTELTTLKNAPPKVVTVQAPAPAPKPPAKKVAPKKKTTPKKKPVRRRR